MPELASMKAVGLYQKTRGRRLKLYGSPPRRGRFNQLCAALNSTVSIGDKVELGVFV